MHAQIVTFRLDGPAEADFRRMCEEVAPASAEIPGLISKLWLADPASTTYAGVYTWRDRRAMEDYLASDFFAAVKANPALAGLSSKDFAVLEGPTRVTHGLAAVPA